VVSTRKDGRFVVNVFDGTELVEKGVEDELKVCKNCLSELDYDGYEHASRGERNGIWEAFELAEYFEKYETEIAQIPRHTAETAPLYF